jgi:hypothetical protein
MEKNRWSGNEDKCCSNYKMSRNHNSFNYILTEMGLWISEMFNSYWFIVRIKFLTSFKQ